MCSNYQPVFQPAALAQAFGVAEPASLNDAEMWPSDKGCFVRLSAEHSGLELVTGRWGMEAPGMGPGKSSTFNARSETAAVKPTFKDAWAHGQRCIVPVMELMEPDWRSGKAVQARISRVDGRPMGVAGLWSRRQSPDGWRYSYTMLTVNADHHPLMNQLHRPGKEKRMVVILHEADYAGWLGATLDGAKAYLRSYPAELLQTTYAPDPQLGLGF